MIPHEQREPFVRELTERTVDDFFEARGLDTGCEYSYVIHHRESDDPQAPGMHNPHAHVVLPGTVWSEEHSERIPRYFSQNKKVNYIELLHAVTEQNMERDAGSLYWSRSGNSALMPWRVLRETQKQTIQSEAHGVHIDPDGQQIPFWGGVRQVDEHSCAVGYYLPFHTKSTAAGLSFVRSRRDWIRTMPNGSAQLSQRNYSSIPVTNSRSTSRPSGLLPDEGHETIRATTAKSGAISRY